jgi:hypothetical protein
MLLRSLQDQNARAGGPFREEGDSLPFHLVAFARGEAAEAREDLIEASAVGPGGAGAEVGSSLAQSTEERRLAAMRRAKGRLLPRAGAVYIHPPAPPLPVAAATDSHHESERMLKR